MRFAGNSDTLACYYGVLRDTTFSSSGRRLVTIDPLTGVATNIGGLPDGFANIEFAGCTDPGTQPAITRAFVIKGISTGVGWSWSLSGTGFSIGIPTPIQVAPVDAGGSAADLASQWIRSLGSPTVVQSCNPGTSSSNLIAMAIRSMGVSGPLPSPAASPADRADSSGRP